jgi:hypothetical protein
MSDPAPRARASAAAAVEVAATELGSLLESYSPSFAFNQHEVFRRITNALAALRLAAAELERARGPAV